MVSFEIKNNLLFSFKCPEEFSDEMVKSYFGRSLCFGVNAADFVKRAHDIVSCGSSASKLNWIETRLHVDQKRFCAKISLWIVFATQPVQPLVKTSQSASWIFSCWHCIFNSVVGVQFCFAEYTFLRIDLWLKKELRKRNRFCSVVSVLWKKMLKLQEKTKNSEQQW